MNRRLRVRTRREGVDSLGRFPQVPGADNVVALEHRAGLVPGELHRDTLGHACSHKIADGRSAKVVRDPAGTAGGNPRGR
jgi:hypothetical protein